MRFIVIGNPANRRVTMFQAALVAQQLPPAEVIAWRDVVVPGGPERMLGALSPEPAIVRIDSAGEDEDVERAMIRRGEAAARAEGYAAVLDPRRLDATPRELGRILVPRQYHLGFLSVLREIGAALAQRPAWRVLQTIPAIEDLFDKRVTSAKWQAMGIPVPEFLPAVRDPDDLRAQMEARGWREVFVKVASSSSASCLAIFHHGQTEHAITTVEDTGAARYNTRKLQRLTTRASIDRLLAFLLAEGSQIERAVPKAQLAEHYFDLRVLTIDGVPAFIVVRAAPHPITNLHLGGQRGDLDALRKRVPKASWDAAMETCVEVQRASGAFHVGIDLMFEPGLRAHRVIEGNAFGDLLPNLTRDGLDVYGWQIARLR
jgi:hypothetical protein